MELKNYIRFLFLALSIFVLSETSEARQYVNSINDFKKHTQTHIRNVNRLAMYLYYENRDSLFRDVPEHALRAKLLLHDYEKLASNEDLKHFGYTKEPFFDRLYRSYGINKNDSESVKVLILDLVEYVEKVDAAFLRMHNFIDSEGNISVAGQKILLIEKIADLVEREKNPISTEEFGVRQMRPASEFFDDSNNQNLARRLSEVYHGVLNADPLIRLAFERPKKRPLTCTRLFG